jgi:16S rRNA (cytosine1402-N4)-methyltransferase
LGVSSHHFDDSERGFSFRGDGPLDMRMNKRAGITAADVVNNYSEERLADIFYLYGELKNSRKIASVLAKARAIQPINTIGEFLEVIKPLFGREREKKELAKVFQALRIEVNQEMEALKEMLYAATEALKPGGRLVVITYHSLEDRMVKNIMKTGNIEGKSEQDFFGNVQTPFRLVNNKVIVASDEEVAKNPRSRSAKLRIAEKK